MKIPFVIGLSGILGAVVATQAGSADTLLEKHTTKLQDSHTVDVQYTVQNLPGGGPIEYKLKLGKQGKYRLETPDETIVANGKTVWDYKKADNSYTQVDQSDSDLKSFLKKDEVFPWIAFYKKDAFKEITGQKVGANRIMKGKAITEVSMTLPGTPERTATLFIDQTLGVARGVSLKTGEDKQVIIMAKELAVSATDGTDADFAFAVPDGAKKVDPAAAASAANWDSVAPIFSKNCSGCHNSNNPRSGLDLTSYASTIAGGRGGSEITPGDPDNSRLTAFLKGNGRPLMPPRGALSDADIATISTWIKAGAKEK